MGDHYYTEVPGSAHDERAVTVRALGQELTFLTDAGVFSRDGLDRGTELLLEALPALSGRVLDLGCGWGAVGVSLAKRYPACRVTMSDVNRRALDLAAKNAQSNGARAQCVQSDGLDAVEGPFDLIVTNPPIRAGKQVIYRLFAQSADRLSPGGALYLVIRKQQGAESAIKYLKTIFSQVDTVEKSGGFWVIRCIKREETEDEV